MTTKQKLLDDPHVWGATLAAKFAREIGLPHGNYWEPPIARRLTRMITDEGFSRDECEMLMSLQLGIARTRETDYGQR